ncbi:MAG: TetR/AcrR family transcriptional regulator, partial [Bryobacteraceae bacterium]
MPRVPSVRAHEDALKAALRLIAARGIDGTSVDAIAAESGVSKATIYKHWKNKDALCIEAVGRLRGQLPVFDSGDARADITKLLKHLISGGKRADLARIWPRIIGYAVANPAFGKAFRDSSEGPRRKALTRLLRRCIAGGELRADLDFDIAMDLLLGPIMHSRFMNAEPPPSDLSRRIVDAFW